MSDTDKFGLTWDEIEAVRFLVDQAIQNHMPLDAIFEGGTKTANEAAWLYQEVTGKPFVFGVRPSPPDPRDKKVGALPSPKVDNVDFRELCSPIENQRNLGSCAANAYAGCTEYLEKKKGISIIEDVSRLYVYYNARESMGTINEDSGVYLRDLMKGVQKYGWCDEKIWPYEIRRFKEKPPQNCYDDGQKHKIQEFLFLRPRDVDHARQVIAQGYPVIGAMYCYEGLMDDKLRNGIIDAIPMPKDGEQPDGGHAIGLMGFNDKRRAFLMRNSWGPAWCLQGYVWMPYEYYEKQTFDAVVVEAA